MEFFTFVQIKTMYYKAISISSLMVAILAVFALLPAFEEHRNRVTRLGRNLLYGDDEPNESTTTGDIVMTKQQLLSYDGGPKSRGLYLAVLGKIYDVSAGAKHYGPNGGYHAFAAKDASRAYVTGQFDTDLTDNLDELQDTDMLQLDEWQNFYEEKYKYIGKLVGHFYDKLGKPTNNLKTFEKRLDTALGLRTEQLDDNNLYPPCNAAWAEGKGSTVWCSNESGGIKRDWVGVPRSYFKPGSKHARCACVKTTGKPSNDPQASTENGDLNNPHFQLYKNCDPLSVACKIDSD
ncbi:neuferricin-like [Tubulanus polymorphus]|uniref:neuferricin-like n=1 Tax=Tubulanus polymorphus TaxID=672921 RepID=UPI003DA2FD35